MVLVTQKVVKHNNAPALHRPPAFTELGLYMSMNAACQVGSVVYYRA
jgi:hypothetical protein